MKTANVKTTKINAVSETEKQLAELRAKASELKKQMDAEREVAKAKRKSIAEEAAKIRAVAETKVQADKEARKVALAARKTLKDTVRKMKKDRNSQVKALRTKLNKEIATFVKQNKLAPKKRAKKVVDVATATNLVPVDSAVEDLTGVAVVISQPVVATEPVTV